MRTQPTFPQTDLVVEDDAERGERPSQLPAT